MNGAKVVCVASSRPEIGNDCVAWARRNLPEGWWLTTDPAQHCHVFISVLWDRLLTEDYIAKRRCYNFHPGLLPRYRGSGAYSWAIINGEDETGVTLHELTVDMDQGPIIAQTRTRVCPTDTAQTLHGRCMDDLFALFREWFPHLLANDAISTCGTPQDEDKARTWYRRDLQRQRDLTRFVRAFTFEGKEPAFYIDREGNKHELRW